MEDMFYKYKIRTEWRTSFHKQVENRMEDVFSKQEQNRMDDLFL